MELNPELLKALEELTPEQKAEASKLLSENQETAKANEPEQVKKEEPEQKGVEEKQEGLQEKQEKLPEQKNEIPKGGTDELLKFMQEMQQNFNKKFDTLADENRKLVNEKKELANENKALKNQKQRGFEAQPNFDERDANQKEENFAKNFKKNNW